MGVWSEVAELQDSHLQHLACQLPGVLINCLAPSTTKQYVLLFNKWRDWANLFPEVDMLPVKSLHLSLFIMHMDQSGVGVSYLGQLIPALAWAHRQARLPFEGDSQLVRDTISGLRRLNVTVREPKEPIEFAHLFLLVNATDFQSLTDVRVLCMILLGFFGFLRFSELSNIRRSQIFFSGDHVRIFLPKSKTDQFRDGANVVLSVLDSAICPVEILKRYLCIGQISDSDERFIFRGIQASGKVKKLRKADQFLSYTRCREIVLNKLEQIGLQRKSFGLHSLRSGGATAAAASGVPDRLFRIHGRWRSEFAKDLYVRNSLEDRMAVTQNMFRS